MSNRERCISILDSLAEEQLASVAVMLQSIRKLLDEAADDAYCQKLYLDYLNDTDPEVDNDISLHEYANELGIDLK